MAELGFSCLGLGCFLGIADGGMNPAGCSMIKTNRFSERVNVSGEGRERGEFKLFRSSVFECGMQALATIVAIDKLLR